jgi:hypothetical protein
MHASTEERTKRKKYLDSKRQLVNKQAREARRRRRLARREVYGESQKRAVKKYRELHWDRVIENGKRRARKEREEVKDSYVRKSLSQVEVLPFRLIPQALVDVHRVIIQIKRSIRHGQA